MPLPTNRLPGDTIHAADINNIAAAVNALPSLTSATPAPTSATGSAGVATDAARSDHVHADTTGAGGAGIGWTLIVNEAGTALTNWTTVAGTWAVDAGGYIKQTATTGYAGLRYNSRVPVGAGLVMQADMAWAGTVTDALRMFVAPASDAVVAASQAAYGGLDAVNGVAFQRGQAAVEFAGSVPTAGTFYTVRSTLLGGYLTIALNGTPVGTFTAQPANDTRYDYPMLVAYKGEARFKNIRVWRLDGPA